MFTTPDRMSVRLNPSNASSAALSTAVGSGSSCASRAAREGMGAMLAWGRMLFPALPAVLCVRCGAVADEAQPLIACQSCGGPFALKLAEGYGGSALALPPSRSAPWTPGRGSRGGVWRWRDWLPVRDERNIVSLGEGDTPVV